MEDNFLNLPESIVERIKENYEAYKITAEEPVLTFEDFSLKIYELGLAYRELKATGKEIIKLKKELGSITEEDYILYNF